MLLSVHVEYFQCRKSYGSLAFGVHHLYVLPAIDCALQGVSCCVFAPHLTRMDSCAIFRLSNHASASLSVETP